MKTEMVTLMKVDYHEVEKVIMEVYGFEEYNLPYTEELVNDISLEWNITGEVSEQQAQKITDRNQHYSTRVYMNDLARQGIIEKGTYLIDICW